MIVAPFRRIQVAETAGAAFPGVREMTAPIR